jgi:hypothetical protein
MLAAKKRKGLVDAAIDDGIRITWTGLVLKIRVVGHPTPSRSRRHQRLHDSI